MARSHTVCAPPRPVVACFLGLIVWAAVVTGAAAAGTTSQLLEQGHQLFAAGKTSEAIDVYNQAIAQDPRNANALYRRAIAFLSLGRGHQAENDLTKVITLDPSLDQAYIRRAAVRFKQGNWAEARADLETYIARVPHDPEAKAKLNELKDAQQASDVATAALQTKRYQDAVAHATKVIEMAPQSSKLRILRGDAFLALEDVEAAIADFTRAAMLSAADAALFLRIAELHVRLGEIDSANEQLRQCLRSDPENKPCLQLRRKLKDITTKLEAGRNLMDQRQWAKAASHYEQVLPNLVSSSIKLPRQQHEVLHNLCSAYLKTKEAAKAVEACTQAVQLNNGDWESYVNRAEARIAQEDYEGGTPSSYSAAHGRVAACPVKRHFHPFAVTHLQRVNGRLHESHDRRNGDEAGTSMAMTPTNRTAVQDYRKANEVSPNNRQVVEGLQRAEKLAKNASRVDYYKVLGVPRTASKREIKRANTVPSTLPLASAACASWPELAAPLARVTAYRQLAQEWHPDKYRGDDLVKAQAKMAQINAANEVLSDDELRAKYDQGEDPNDPARNQQQQGHPFGGFGGFSGFPGGFQFGGPGGFQFRFQ